MPYLISALAGYLIGGINPSYIIARIKGFDIRTRGSGNAGASNAVITMGKAVGVFSALFDILKAFLTVCVCSALFRGDVRVCAVAGVACIIGHMYPVFMGFDGGKGLACLGGVFFAYDFRIAVVAVLIELVLALAVDYICIVPLTAGIALPIINFVITRDAVTTAIYSLAAVLFVIKHTENLRRIKNGTEVRMSFLWKGKKELERAGVTDSADN